MKLLFVIKMLSASGGGAERVLANVAGALARRGHDVTVASFDTPERADFYPLDPSIRRVRLGVGDNRRRARLGETVRRMRAVRRLVRTTAPDAVIGFMHSVFVPQGLALLGTGVPLIGSEHIVYDHYRTRPLQAMLLRLTPHLLDGLTVISARVRDTFPAALRGRMTIIPNPVEAMATARADLAGGPRKRILAVGRLEEQKDHAVLIAAFAEVAPRHPDWDLRIVGEGDLRDAMTAQIAALGLGQRIELPGATAAIADEYASAQVLAIPSRYESFGLVTAEAMAHGLPAVGFADCPGTNELIVDGGNGLLVEGDGDRATALAAGLERLMGSADLRRRLGKAAPASIDRFGIDTIADAWEALLRAVVR